ncbi:MAG: hypothetical protein HQL51_12690 [Magnetococcales bacterium]|nr:hypothetical protein [Magnetococcales bacterium]
MVRLNAGRPVFERKGRVCLAYAPRRIAPEGQGGRQPVVGRGGNSLSLFHGVLGNRKDLIAELDLSRSPQPLDDGAVASAAMERWGEAAPSHFRGDFALAHWEEELGRLTLATDPLGRCALYYVLDKEVLFFSSMLPPLLASPSLDRSLDEPFLVDFLTDAPSSKSGTFFKAIRRVPAASRLIFEEGKTPEVRTYWEPDWTRTLRLAHDEAYVEMGRALLDQAVRRMLRGPGPTVSLLSGGLDAASVVATAARLLAPETIFTLTAHPPEGVPWLERPGKFSDERFLARQTAAFQANIRAEFISSASLHPLDEDPRQVFKTIGMPVRNPLSLGWFAPLFERAKSLGADRLLTGASGNHGLSWEGMEALPTLAKRGEWRALARETLAISKRSGRSPWKVWKSDVVFPALPEAAKRRWLKWRHPEQSAVHHAIAIRPEFVAEMGRDGWEVKWLPGDATTRRSRWLTALQARPLHNTAFGALFGLDFLDPLGDRDLLEFCYAVPDDQYLRHGVTRWLARRVLADRLPPAVIQETRIGDQCPEFLHRMTLQRPALRQALDQVERSPLVRRVLDVPRMKALEARWPDDVQSARFVDYGAVLHRSLHVAQFIQWAEEGAPLS